MLYGLKDYDDIKNVLIIDQYVCDYLRKRHFLASVLVLIISIMQG